MSKPVAIITGAGRGIGRATAKVLSDGGYRIGLIARNEVELQETASTCADAIVLPADVSDASALQAAVAKAHAHFGRTDAAIHCAGLAPVASIEEMTLKAWEQVLAVNLTAAFVLAKAVWPIFKAQAGGSIVNVSSIAARDPFGGFLAYGSAKAGVNTFGLALAREGEPHGIRVHTVAPGATETAMFRGLFSNEQFSREKTMNPGDVARVIAQCVCGDLRYTSGEVIYVRKTIT